MTRIALRDRIPGQDLSSARADNASTALTLEALLGDRTEISSEEVPMKSKRDLLSALSAVAYGSENGYEIQAEDGYLETQQMLLRRFKIERRKEK